MYRPRHHTSSGTESSAPPASRDQIGSQASLLPSNSASSRRYRDHDDGGSKISMNSNDGGGDDGNKPSASNAEDIDIRMDLTEDLLHLVGWFSFVVGCF